jgi:hypothetical protein
MSYVDLWYQDLVKRRSLRLERTLTLEGVRDAHLGPRFEYAKVRAVVEPCTMFEVVDESAGVEQAGYLEAAVFGFLDVVLTAPREPLLGVRLRVLALDVHPVDSSKMAFRQAGRDLARKLVDALERRP